jgi:hypothetical protein
MGRGAVGVSRKTGLPRFVSRIRNGGREYLYFRFGPHRTRLPDMASPQFAGSYAALLVEHGLAVADQRCRPFDPTKWAQVYFIQDMHTGAIKIGSARFPEVRLKELQTGTSAELRLLSAVPGGQALERDLHERFAHLRIRGEWFLNSPEIRSCMRDLRR